MNNPDKLRADRWFDGFCSQYAVVPSRAQVLLDYNKSVPVDIGLMLGHTTMDRLHEAVVVRYKELYSS